MFKIYWHCLVYMIFTGFIGLAQSNAELEVKETINTFFDGFHQRDTTIIRSVADKEMVLQTMGRDKEGRNRLRTDPFEQFLISIASIPDSLNFKEELLDIRIQIDGPMAHAWTPYNFWIDQKLSHCGVNSFQLFNNGTMWKIIYLADTRRKDNCTIK
ncbi:MAG: nuclear transport factor 2 family protein [Flavobacteriaceae bacterium]